MKSWQDKIVPVAFAVSAALFLFAAFKPMFNGQPLNAAFLVIGAVSFVIAIVTWQKSRSASTPSDV